MRDSALPTGDPVVELVEVVKSFSGNVVLDRVSVAFVPGAVHALMGANGAGKSTLIKVLAGVHQPDAGQVVVAGRPVHLGDPLAAQRAGVQAVHQNPNDGVVPGLSVAENLALDRLVAPGGGLGFSRRRTERHALQIAERLGLRLTRADLREDVRELGVSDRQLLVLARALSREPRLLILDEPTSALSASEAERLFAVVRDLAARGVAVVYVSHRPGEIDALADRVTVLRDGRHAGTFTRPLDWRAVFTAMFGSATAAIRHAEQRGEDVVAEVRGARVWPDAPEIDLELRRGEVTGVLGLIGAGKSELALGLFGARPFLGGWMRVDGRPYAPRHPAEAINRGVYLLPEDRHEDALVPSWSVTEVMTLPFLRRLSRMGMVRRSAERETARTLVADLGIVCTDESAPIESLSGGNQQKVVVARWLIRPPRLLILDEPFRGVDIGARLDISTRARAVAAEAAVMVVSSDVDEILEVADRVLVMRGGGVVLDARMSAVTRDLLVDAMSGALARSEER